ncbi:MAG: HAD-IA family hydrolase [Nitrospiraceae bacterium]|nr:HAD-IA family hydrolase [Nitrospiraceae bacterium]
MIEMRPAKGILFDLGGTLLGEFAFDHQAGRRRLFESARNPRGVTMEEYAHIAQEYHTTVWADRDEHMIEVPVRSFWRMADERLGLAYDASPDEMEWEFWKTAATMSPEPGVAEALSNLTARELPLGVLSNSAFSGEVLTRELGRHDLAGCFKFVISSADYGIRKPHRSLFLTAAARLGIEPQDVWFIGDSPAHDIAGAKAAGMTAIAYSPNGDVSADPAPHAVLRHWDDLAPLLDAQGSSPQQ